ncbi:MAG: hypothetical protein ABMA25_20295 [Ilumatobacteraceae bacterium]
MLRGRVSVVVLAMGCAVGACDSRSSGPTTTTTQLTSVDSTKPRGRDQIDSEILVVAFDGAAASQPAPYFGTQDASGGASEPAAGFEPAASYQDFCWAVSVINTRPQPRDEFEEIVVASQYLSAIEPYVAPELSDELAVLIDFTVSVVERGSFTEANEVGDDSDVAAALETINEFVDRECLGR